MGRRKAFDIEREVVCMFRYACYEVMKFRYVIVLVVLVH